MSLDVSLSFSYPLVYLSLTGLRCLRHTSPPSLSPSGVYPKSFVFIQQSQTVLHFWGWAQSTWRPDTDKEDESPCSLLYYITLLHLSPLSLLFWLSAAKSNESLRQLSGMTEWQRDFYCEPGRPKTVFIGIWYFDILLLSPLAVAKAASTLPGVHIKHNTEWQNTEHQ